MVQAKCILCAIVALVLFNGLTQSPYENVVRFSGFGGSCSNIDVISQRIFFEIF